MLQDTGTEYHPICRDKTVLPSSQHPDLHILEHPLPQVSRAMGTPGQPHPEFKTLVEKEVEMIQYL